MSEKKKLTLSSVIEQFENSLKKEAAETEVPDAGDKEVETAAPKPEPVEKEIADAETAAEAETDTTPNTPDKGPADEGGNKALKEAGEAEDVVSGLKAIAKTASENSQAAMEKEAQEFGKLFAQSAFAEMQKLAEEQETYDALVKRAYEEAETLFLQTKLAEVSEEAYTLCAGRLAELGAVEKTAEEAAAEPLTSDQAKSIIKEAYEITQALIDSRQE